MKTELKIKKANNGENSYRRCARCSKEITDDSHYIEYGMKYAKKNFHLTCFNNITQKNLKKIGLCINNMNNNLKKIIQFKKRVLLKSFEPMITKNTKSFTLCINNRYYNQPICKQCNKIIDKGDIYVDTTKTLIENYHFICFKHHAKDKLHKWKTYQKEVQNNLKKLEEHKNEMICEGLEGVGKQ